MEELDDLDKNGHRRNTNTNHFASLLESDYKEVTNPRTEPTKTPVIILIEDEDGDKNKGEHKKDKKEEEEEGKN